MLVIWGRISYDDAPRNPWEIPDVVSELGALSWVDTGYMCCGGSGGMWVDCMRSPHCQIANMVEACMGIDKYWWDFYVLSQVMWARSGPMRDVTDITDDLIGWNGFNRFMWLMLCWIMHSGLWFGTGNLSSYTLHIFQGYFTGTAAIIWLPQCQWSSPER